MDRDLTRRLAPLDTVRATIAQCWLGDAGTEPDDAGGAQARLGRITLRPHQLDAVQQLRELLGEYGGAVLADAVGLGKTFVALAIARDARHPLLVCPAGLRDMWRGAARQTDVDLPAVTTESLSHPREAHRGETDLVVVDEAHHFRNPHTRRYRALARITAGAQVLLVTATPVHNRIGDLIALLSLFLGARAWTLSDTERGRCLVRRDHRQVCQGGAGRNTSSGASAALRLPTVEGPRTLVVGDDAATLEAITALPPPVPPRDGDACGALMAIGLVRQWASSAGALRAALRRRLERAAAIGAALEGGLYPSYRDLRAWCIGDGAIQLALPEVLLPAPPLSGPSSIEDAGADRERAEGWRRELQQAVRTHADAVRGLLRRLDRAPDSDLVRADRLRIISRAHPGTKVVAFTAYEDTVRALYRHLRADGRVCALSAHGGLIASGRVSRAHIVAQFTPNHDRRLDPDERIDVLLATDLLSEGVNLQAAGIVVHLDLPWTPARLEQRVGRVARLGSSHQCVYVYAFAPPAPAELMLQIERRLRAKVDAAGRAVGIAGSIVPSITSAQAAVDRPSAGIVIDSHAGNPAGGSASIGSNGPVLASARGCVAADSTAAPQRGPPEQLAAARLVVIGWRRPSGSSRADGDGPLCGAVRTPASGFVAACVAGSRRFLVGTVGGPVSDAPAVIAEAVRVADGEPGVPTDAACVAAIRALGAWWCEQQAAEDAGLSRIAGATARLRVFARIASIVRRAPAHLRPSVLALSDRARRATAAPFGTGAEWVLGQLAGASLPDIAWLRTISAFGDTYGARVAPQDVAREGLRVSALIVFGEEDR
jgi:superfamily II DNA or RNA helicase